jgi:hypothetical protein
MENWNRQASSRYLDHADDQRTSVIMFDLLSKVNHQNAKSSELFRSGLSETEVDGQVGEPVFDRLNAILADADMKIRLVLNENQTIDAINVERDATYPIFQMSDGEKSAVLLGMEVLVPPAGTVFIIDEPERHLHRSISASLVEASIAARADCHFVVLTHDLDLAAELSAQSGQTLAINDCVWVNSRVVAWDLQTLDSEAEMPESARRAILGGRRDILFIEGSGESLDIRLYNILFPRWSFVPAGGSAEVVRDVTGVKASEVYHWVNARGVVDGDGRTDEERASLAARGVLVLPVSEVESLYYLGSVIDSVAASQARSLDLDPAGVADTAKARALAALGSSGTPERLASDLALREVHRKAVDALPTTLDAGSKAIDISIPSPYESTLAKIRAGLDAGNLEELTRLLPIRDTAMRSQVATALGFRSIDDYESAARVRIRDDIALLESLRSIVGALP